MALPAFASFDDLANRIPGGIGDADVARAQAALDDASALIRQEAGKNWTTDDVLDADRPDILVTICCSAARRSLENPEGVSQESLGSYSVSHANVSNDVYLTSAERAAVRSAAGLSGGAFAIDTVATTVLDGHAEVCALRFGALYCSCGADLTLGYPLYELP